MSAERNRSRPGCVLRCLSLVPMFNWAALICLGMGWSGKRDILLGALYGVVSFVIPESAPFLWIVGMVHYAVACRRAQGGESAPPTPVVPRAEKKPPVPPREKIPVPEPGRLYTPVEIQGQPERKEPIPVRTPAVPVPTPSQGDVIREASGIRTVLSAEERFYRDMKKYAPDQGKEAPFAPYGEERPVYENMLRRQRDWYFCWRGQVRRGEFPETDVGYIWLYTFELLNGQDWETASEGLEKLTALWRAYRPRFPSLDARMFPWCLDFAWKHGLPCRIPDMEGLVLPEEKVLRDLMIDAYSGGKPLKLPFALVDALCVYSITGSKFYKDGHQALMEEAIPRVVALADAALWKEKNKGLLAVYGPARTRKQPHYPFRGAVCPGAGQRTEISVRAYTSSQKLGDFINVLVRYAENVLRSICGYRGRLRGVELDPGTAALVEGFLKKEYDRKGKPDAAPAERQKLQLDFDNIAMLRAQSDEVRDALEVPQDRSGPKEELTDLQAVTELMQALDAGQTALMDRLCEQGWEMAYTPGMEQEVAGINAKAVRWLACALLAREGDLLIVEDDYRDELNRIYAMKKARGVSGKQGKPAAESRQDRYFDTQSLSPPLAALVDAMSALQCRAVVIVLEQADVEVRLAALAEEAMTMPEILIDEINELAAEHLDDILIDGFAQVPCVLEQYADELKKARI